MKSELPSLRWFSIDKKAFERHLDENLKQRKLKTCSCGSRGMSRIKVNRAFLVHQNSTVKNKNKMFLFRKFHHKKKVRVRPLCKKSVNSHIACKGLPIEFSDERLSSWVLGNTNLRTKIILHIRKPAFQAFEIISSPTQGTEWILFHLKTSLPKTSD